MNMHRRASIQPHQRQAFLDVFVTPHSDVLVRLFGINASTLMTELEKVLRKLTGGLEKLFTDLNRFRDDSFERLSGLAEEPGITEIEALRDKLFEDPELAASRRDRIGGELTGLDFFDVEKVTHFPEYFSTSSLGHPARSRSSCATGEFRGWPLRVWPTMKRPFIRLHGRILLLRRVRGL